MTMTHKLTLLVAGAALFGCASTVASPTNDLRLRHVVLYQNGIGFFERTGVLREDRLRLSFREREIDDVLKSIVVVEEGAGAGKRPSTVSARLPEAKEKSGDRESSTVVDVFLSPRTNSPISLAYAVPTAAWKATYRVILPDERNRGAPALLQAWALIDNVSDEDWNGVMLTLATGAPMSFASDLRSPRFVARPDAGGRMIQPTTTGPVVAERTQAVDKDADGIVDADDACPSEPGPGDKRGCPSYHREVLLSSNEIRIMQQVQFEKGSDVVSRASEPVLDAIAEVLRQNPSIKAVEIGGHVSNDEKDGWALSTRRAGAIQSALLKRGVATRLRVQAFGDTRAIAPNQTEEGRRKNRRVEFRVDEAAEGEAAASGAKRGAAGLSQIDAVKRTGSAAAAPHDVAGAVRYDIYNAVSIPKRSSALVTIINDYVPGEDAYLFRPDASAPGSERHPMRAARIENRGNHGLQAGSVAVFSQGTFVGEGLIDRLSPGDKAMIPYALDSGTSVTVSSESTEKPVKLVSIARGVMIVENVSIVTTRYEIAAGKQTPARMFVRHARRTGYTAQALPPETETTQEAHLVPIPMTPGRTSVLTIEERMPLNAQLAFMEPEGARLGLYLAESPLAPEADKEVRELIAMRAQLAKLDEDIDALRQQLNDAGQRSGELRESLRAIERTPKADPLQKKLMDALTEVTVKIEKLSATLADKRASHAEKRARLVERLREVRLGLPAQKP